MDRRGRPPRDRATGGVPGVVAQRASPADGVSERQRQLGGPNQRLRHLVRAALGELSPGALRLAAMAVEPRDRLEVGIEHDHTLLPGRLGDQRVQRLLGRREPAARLPVAVVHDDKGDTGRAADPREEGDVRLAAALDDRDRLPVDVVAERREHERQHELLGQTLDEDDRAGEEELAAGRVELGHHAEVLVGRHRLRLEGARARAGRRSTKTSSSSRVTLRKAGECVV